MIASLLAGVVHLVTGAQARWSGCEPSDAPRIYFANHASHLDAVVIWAALPSPLRARTSPVAARDYWESSALRRYLAADVFKATLIDRGPGAADEPAAARSREESVARARAAVEATARALDGGRSLILFPEGTRGTGEGVAPFKSGLFYLARLRPDVELVPTWLENLNRILPKGESLLIPMLGSVTFGAPISLAPEESKDAFLARARETLVALGRS